MFNEIVERFFPMKHCRNYSRTNGICSDLFVMHVQVKLNKFENMFWECNWKEHHCT